MPPIRDGAIHRGLSEGFIRARESTSDFMRRKSHQLKSQLMEIMELLQKIKRENQLVRQIVGSLEEKIKAYQRILTTFMVLFILFLLVWFYSIIFIGFQKAPTEELHSSFNVDSRRAYQHYLTEDPSQSLLRELNQESKEEYDYFRQYLSVSGNCINKWTLGERMKYYFKQFPLFVHNITQIIHFPVYYKKSFGTEAIIKYHFFEAYRELIQDQINSRHQKAIKLVQQEEETYKKCCQDNRPYDWKDISRNTNLQSIKLFGLMNDMYTGSYHYTDYNDQFSRTYFPFLWQKHGWEHLENMLNGKSCWVSSGYILTVGSIPHDSELSIDNFNLFVPTIIRFVFPHTVPDNFNLGIQGYKVNFKQILSNNAFIERQNLRSFFNVQKTEQESKNKLPVRRNFYCENTACQQAFMLIKITSNFPLQICELNIESVFSYDWKYTGGVSFGEKQLSNQLNEMKKKKLN